MTPSPFWKLMAKVAVVAAPALVTGFFSYQKAQVEADAGYQTLLGALKDSQRELRDLHDRVVVLEVKAERPAPRLSKPETWPEVKTPDAAPPPRREYRPRALPEDLSGAVMEHLQMKK